VVELWISLTHRNFALSRSTSQELKIMRSAEKGRNNCN
jgi:hypothetical protein